MIGKAIVSILTTNISLTAYISDRVFPHVIDMQATTLPAVVYRVVSQRQVDSKSGSHNLHYYTVEISAVTKKYLDAETISDLIRTAMTSASGSISGITVKLCEFSGRSDDQEGTTGIHIINQTFNIIVTL